MQVVVALEFAQSGNVSKRLLYKINPLGDRTDMIFYVRDAARQALLFFFFLWCNSLTYSSFHLSLEPVVLFCLSDQIALHRTSAAAGLFISSHLNLNFVSPFQLHLPFALWLAFHFWLHFCLWLRLFLNVVIVCEWACNAVPGHLEHLGQH